MEQHQRPCEFFKQMAWWCSPAQTNMDAAFAAARAAFPQTRLLPPCSKCPLPLNHQPTCVHSRSRTFHSRSSSSSKAEWPKRHFSTPPPPKGHSGPSSLVGSSTPHCLVGAKQTECPTSFLQNRFWRHSAFIWVALRGDVREGAHPTTQLA